MLSDLQAIEAVFGRATCPEDIFGVADRVKHEYRRLVQVVHPDRYEAEPDAKIFAQRLMAELTHWYDDASMKIAAGTYGDGKAHVRAPAPPTFEVQVVKTPKRTYTITAPLASGDIADLYRCSFHDDRGSFDHGPIHAVFKIARHPGDNDLLENEHKALTALYPEAQAPTGPYRYLPKILDSFLLRGKGGSRRVNVLAEASDFVSLADVLQAYPDGIDFRDAAWMFKRGLEVIDFVHRQGRVHGAVLPTHLLVRPSDHGGRLVDWSYSVPTGEKVRALSTPYRTFYAPEILHKDKVTPATDLFMLAATIKAIVRHDPPQPFANFLKTCTFLLPSRRPQDAFDLLQDFDELLLRLVGPRKFRPFHMPAT